MSKRAEIRRQERLADASNGTSQSTTPPEDAPVLRASDALMLLQHMDISEEEALQIEKDILIARTQYLNEEDGTITYLPALCVWISFDDRLPDWYFDDLARRTPSGSIL